MFLIISADSRNQLDEYSNEGNNLPATRLHVAPLAFADLVTSAVVAPDQVTHGSTVAVSYSVSNKGSGITRGEGLAQSDPATMTWTDSVWLTVDKRRPSAAKGDIRLGQVSHTGALAVGADYAGTLNVQIPDDLRSGQYFITVWSDTYDAVREDTLASNLNPDDPNQTDNNNNYKARAVTVLGISPPDLVVTAVSAPASSAAGGGYSFSYTVSNRGDGFSGNWSDRVWLADNPDLSLAQNKWRLCTSQNGVNQPKSAAH